MSCYYYIYEVQTNINIIVINVIDWSGTIKMSTDNKNIEQYNCVLVFFFKLETILYLLLA